MASRAEQGRSKPTLTLACSDSGAAQDLNWTKRILPWVLFVSFVTLTIVLLVLFLVFEDHNLNGRESGVMQDMTSGAVHNASSSSTCGRRAASRHPGIDLRVSGGRPTSIESWPWMTSLRDDEGTHFCGASLISDRWLLTAAHCLSSVTSSKVLATIVMGDTSLEEPSEYHVTRDTFRIWVHTEFNSSTFDHDIALISFDPPIIPTEGVSPACLNEDTRELAVFDKCFVVGWGATSYADIRSTMLQEGRLPLVPFQNCSDAYAGRHHVTSDMICAVSSDQQIDTCKGDSGGPLMCEDSASAAWSVVGVTSFGYGCNNPGNPAPGVYARVSRYYTSFIVRTVDGDGRR